MEDATDLEFYEDTSNPDYFDVSGNVLVYIPNGTSLLTQEQFTESISQVRSDLSDSDSLTNSVFTRYSIICTLVICFCLVVFNHRR